MSRTTADVVYGVTGQTLIHRVMQGRPTSATFEVFNDYASDDDTAEFSGTATVDSVTTTVDAASGPAQSDPQKLSIASTASIVIGRKYLLSEAGKQEWVEPIEIVTNDYIRVRHPLRSDYTTAATLVGTYLSAAVDSTWVADLGNLGDSIDPNPSYRVRWEVVVGGATVPAYTFFDFVRASISHQIDLSDLNDRAPGLVDSCPMDYSIDQGRTLIDSAWRQCVADLARLGIDSDALRDDFITDELTIRRALNMLARGGWAPGSFSVTEYVLVTQQDYDRFFEQHFQVAQPHKMATGTGGGAEVVRQFVIGK
jgi:hypothetical protein